MLSLLSHPLFFVLNAIALLISLTIHECAHAVVADRLGDPTPSLQGRITLNPLAHLDPLGTLLLFVTGFGWGKPVVFDPYNLKNPRKDAALIALAGPASNFILAGVLSLILHLIPLTSTWASLFLVPLIVVNISLALFNLIPVHPLDGGKILLGFIPEDLAREWDHILSQYGSFILLFLILPLYNGVSAVSYLLAPIRTVILQFLLP